jgi:hypothetical protein
VNRRLDAQEEIEARRLRRLGRFFESYCRFRPAGDPFDQIDVPVAEGVRAQPQHQMHRVPPRCTGTAVAVNSLFLMKILGSPETIRLVHENDATDNLLA